MKKQTSNAKVNKSKKITKINNIDIIKMLNPELLKQKK